MSVIAALLIALGLYVAYRLGRSDQALYELEQSNVNRIDRLFALLRANQEKPPARRKAHKRARADKPSKHK